MWGSVFGFESTEYTLTYFPPICDATLPYSFSPATTATVLPLRASMDAPADVNDEVPATAIRAAPIPSMPLRTMANLNTRPPSAGLRRYRQPGSPPTHPDLAHDELTSHLSGSVSDNRTIYLK